MTLLDEWLVCKQQIIDEQPLTYGPEWLSLFAQAGLIETDRFYTTVNSITNRGMTEYEAEISTFITEHEE